MGVNRLGRSHLAWPLNARNPQVGIPDLRVSRLCACVERCCCYITRSGSLAVAFASNLLLVGYACGFLEQLAVGVAQPAVGHRGVGVALRAVVQLLTLFRSGSYRGSNADTRRTSPRISASIYEGGRRGHGSIFRRDCRTLFS